MTSWAGPQTLDSQPAGVVEQVIGDQGVRESHTLAVSHTSHTGMCETGAIERRLRARIHGSVTQVAKCCGMCESRAIEVNCGKI